MRTSGLLWPTLIVATAMALLLGLGTWQMSRKAWKEGLQAQIEARVRETPQRLTPGLVTASAVPGGIEYLRVTARGRFLHQAERPLYWPALGAQGWLVHTPFLIEDGRLVLVNRGWVPDPLREPGQREAGQPAGSVEITGLIRLPEGKGLFSPDNDPARNTWFWRDVTAMLSCRPGEAETVCRTLKDAARLAYPFTVDAEAGSANPGGWPRGGTTNLQLPNRHLEYALTWYGLALTLIAVYIAFVLSRRRPAS